MGWQDVSGSRSKKDPDILDISPNTTKLVHVLLPDTEEPVSYWTHYIPNKSVNGPKGAVVICPGKNVCPACVANIYRTKRVHAINVWDYELKAVKILEGGNSIFQTLKQIKDQIGTLSSVDISIKKMGSGKDTQYSTIPIPMMQPFDTTQVHGLFPIANLRLPDSVEVIATHIDKMNGNVATIIQQPTTIKDIIIPTPILSEIHTQEPTLQFGKYKGKAISEVYKEDPNYVKWCAESISDPAIRAESKRVVELSLKETATGKGVISDSTAKQLLINEINEVFQEDTRYKGNFALILEKMRSSSTSTLYPNGKTILSEYNLEELQRLSEAIK